MATSPISDRNANPNRIASNSKKRPLDGNISNTNWKGIRFITVTIKNKKLRLQWTKKTKSKLNWLEKVNVFKQNGLLEEKEKPVPCNKLNGCLWRRRRARASEGSRLISNLAHFSCEEKWHQRPHHAHASSTFFNRLWQLNFKLNSLSENKGKVEEVIDASLPKIRSSPSSQEKVTTMNWILTNSKLLSPTITEILSNNTWPHRTGELHRSDQSTKRPSHSSLWNYPT